MNFFNRYVWVTTKCLALALALLFVGCAILPTKEPYPGELLSKLSSNDADRNLVRSLLGTPSVTKNSGEYWFYANIREVVGVLGGPSGAVIEDYEWVAIQFDNSDKVVYYEYNDSVFGCLSNGICHLKGLFPGRLPGTVLTAPRADDFNAKNYPVKENECSIYFFQEPIFHIRAGNYPVSLYVNGNLHGTINYETYLFFTHEPGEINLKSYQFDINTNCNAGEKLYVRAVEGWFVKEGKDLGPVSSAIGVPAIQKRRLALSN